MDAQRVRRAFDHLVDVGVVERIRRVLVIFERLAAQRLGGADEVIDAAGLFILLEREGNGDRAIGLDARRPEAVVDVNGGERNGLDGIIARTRRLGGETNGESEQGCNRFHGCRYYNPALYGTRWFLPQPTRPRVCDWWHSPQREARIRTEDFEWPA